MKALELYRNLPRTNCGRCAPKACMAFAVSVVKGDLAAAACPLLGPEEAARIQAAVALGDWREELIVKLGAELRGADFAAVAAGIGGQVRDGSLVVRCLGREFTLSPDGVLRAAGAASPWERMLVLLYAKGGGGPAPTGAWVSYGELKGGLVKASSFAREGEEPLLALFERDRPGTVAALASLGARRGTGFPAAEAWVIDALPRVPVALLFWPAEEEFPARIKVAFDASADRFLDAEGLIFLVEALVKAIEERLGPPPGRE